MINNTARNGGTMYAFESKLNVYSAMTITKNTVSGNGGGLYLHRSDLNFQDSSSTMLLENKAIDRGGGIYASDSFVTVFFNRSSSLRSLVNFTNNMAQMGGGMYLETAAEIRIVKMGEYLNKTMLILIV